MIELEKSVLIDVIPPYTPIIIRCSADRYGFSHYISDQTGRLFCPRSFSLWSHGWVWDHNPTVDSLGCKDYPRSGTVIVATPDEMRVLVDHGFTDVRVAGLPFAYIPKQHSKVMPDDLLAFPPHSAEIDKISDSQSEYMDYLQSIKYLYNNIYVCIHYLDSDGPIPVEAKKRGLIVIEGARPDDRNSLLRVRAILDSFSQVTSNTMGSHMLYALYSGCLFSFCGPIYSYDETVFLGNGNQHSHSQAYVDKLIEIQSETYLRERFGRFFVDCPSDGIEDINFAINSIGAPYVMSPHDAANALGWGMKAQFRGYLTGAGRRLLRSFK